jgi:hypothetical protein
LLKGFDAWIDYLVDELVTPDLWSTVSGDTRLMELAADQDNRPFTPSANVLLPFFTVGNN